MGTDTQTRYSMQATTIPGVKILVVWQSAVRRRRCCQLSRSETLPGTGWHHGGGRHGPLPSRITPPSALVSDSAAVSRYQVMALATSNARKVRLSVVPESACLGTQRAEAMSRREAVRPSPCSSHHRASHASRLQYSNHASIPRVSPGLRTRGCIAWRSFSSPMSPAVYVGLRREEGHMNHKVGAVCDSLGHCVEP